MLEPDVAPTDFLLAVQCAAFSVHLFHKRDGELLVRRLYAALFGALGVSSLLGGLWHGVFSGRETALGQWVWLCVMAALALGAALLWLISAVQFSSAKWLSRSAGWPRFNSSFWPAAGFVDTKIRS